MESKCHHRFIEGFDDGEVDDVQYIDWYCHECGHWLFDPYSDDALSYSDDALYYLNYNKKERDRIMKWLIKNPEGAPDEDEILLGK